ncbi:hypothetical protein KUTeg_015700 [Tegillarca granosa]|uniref:Uncharacterized protein n=1 Tax=Tegillarca granosa TaxID=220873 RepID=A0ABQ9ENX6_TEGGR|nr:hypothetical protein KUTeg_015700 [Tegillarca granosa]
MTSLLQSTQLVGYNRIFCDILPASSMMGDALLCFSCCITEQPQPDDGGKKGKKCVKFCYFVNIGQNQVIESARDGRESPSEPVCKGGLQVQVIQSEGEAGINFVLNTAQTMMSSKEPQEQISPLNVS